MHETHADSLIMPSNSGPGENLSPEALKIIKGLIKTQKQHLKLIKQLGQEIVRITNYLIELEDYLNKLQGTPQNSPKARQNRPPEPPRNRLDGFWGKPSDN